MITSKSFICSVLFHISFLWFPPFWYSSMGDWALQWCDVDWQEWRRPPSLPPSPPLSHLHLLKTLRSLHPPLLSLPLSHTSHSKLPLKHFCLSERESRGETKSLQVLSPPLLPFVPAFGWCISRRLMSAWEIKYLYMRWICFVSSFEKWQNFTLKKPACTWSIVRFFCVNSLLL